MTQKDSINKLDQLIGKNLITLRKKNAISRTELSQAMNINYKTLWNCENGFNSLSINLLIKMRPIFREKNITLEMLFENIVVSALEQYESDNNK
ncbi:hypothetical protein C5Z25_06835 [Lactobacillus sp. CBA3605]|uniref:helix-turn-helix domain-containing protein n=1 Tax=Lactobacillus sp. CBA3605 TaxID=2099788 RepID=UPI000CFDD07F|nr:helix-turn-helix transcriptional regulator [Lactobacillus sp. CBA3605]AVK61500.1 hypothetical protein C5Z25_06835 [Lactobacillus sp. CBA3605]